MGPAPLLVPSIVTIGIGSLIGTVLALKRPRRALLGALLSGVVPALTTWIVVLHAPLGDLMLAPLLVGLTGLQIALLAVVARAPFPPVRPRAVTGAACTLAVATLVAGMWQARSSGFAWTPGDCQQDSVSNLSRPFVGQGVTVIGAYETDVGAGPWNLTCTANIVMDQGATRTQKLPGVPSRPSGSVVCPGASVLWCPRAEILVVEDTAYRGNALAPARPTFAGNLASFGVPSAHLLLDFLAAAGALVTFVAAARRLPRRRGTALVDDPHPYRVAAPNLPTLPEDRRGSDLAFVAIVVALTGAAPVATVLIGG